MLTALDRSTEWKGMFCGTYEKFLRGTSYCVPLPLYEFVIACCCFSLPAQKSSTICSSSHELEERVTTKSTRDFMGNVVDILQRHFVGQDRIDCVVTDLLSNISHTKLRSRTDDDFTGARGERR